MRVISRSDMPRHTALNLTVSVFCFGMNTYRIYVLSPGGKIMRGDWIEAATEVGARVKAVELCEPGSGAVEVWRGPQRLVSIACNQDN